VDRRVEASQAVDQLSVYRFPGVERGEWPFQDCQLPLDYLRAVAVGKP